MKNKINSKKRCKYCYGYYRYNNKTFASKDMCMACYYRRHLGAILSNKNFWRIFYIIGLIIKIKKLEKRELKW